MTERLGEEFVLRLDHKSPPKQHIQGPHVPGAQEPLEHLIGQLDPTVVENPPHSMHQAPEVIADQ
ncbi:hypothetical protein [Nonomuraea antimicrobica]|uniref:hypothetical protein n=1 Tax=Nonomuraea antimicrobica TaxID=561173 RepID=UPI0031ED9EDB